MPGMDMAWRSPRPPYMSGTSLGSDTSTESGALVVVRQQLIRILEAFVYKVGALRSMMPALLAQQRRLDAQSRDPSATDDTGGVAGTHRVPGRARTPLVSL